MLHVARDDEAAAVTAAKREISLPLFLNETVYKSTHIYICTYGYGRVFTCNQALCAQTIGVATWWAATQALRILNDFIYYAQALALARVV